MQYLFCFMGQSSPGAGAIVTLSEHDSRK